MVRGTRLDTQVDGHDTSKGVSTLELAERLNDVRFLGRHLRGQGLAAHRRRLGHDAYQGGDGLLRQVERAGGERVTGEYARPHGSALADVSGDGASVNVRDANNSLREEFVLKFAPRTPVGCAPGAVAYHEAGDPDP